MPEIRMLIQEQKEELVDMNWKSIIKKARTMADLSESDKSTLEKEKERYNRTIEDDPTEYDSFEEIVNFYLSKGESIPQIVERLDDEYNEWFTSSDGEKWAKSKGGMTHREYYDEVDEMLGEDSDHFTEDYDLSEEALERRSERSADAYFSGGGYNMGDD